MNVIDLHKEKLFKLCAQHRVKELYAFGSILTDKFNEKSDVDLLIQFQRMPLKDYLDNYMELKEKLEELFQRPIDLVENQTIKNPIFRKAIDRDKKIIYERKDSEILV